MSMCMPCQAMPLATAGVELHPALAHQGFRNPTQPGRETIREDCYLCMTCSTRWLRDTDRWGMDQGFRLAP